MKFNLVPALGELQKRTRPEDIKAQRIVHVALTTQDAPNYALNRALARFGELSKFPYLAYSSEEMLIRELLISCYNFQPDLVWMQVQKACILTDRSFLKQLRAACSDNCIIINWTGDIANHTVGYGVSLTAEDWMFEMCEEIDLFLGPCCEYPELLFNKSRYASVGFMQCGIDSEMFDLRNDYSKKDFVANKIVWLSSRYPHVELYNRGALAVYLSALFPDKIVCYGGGWDQLAGIVAPGYVPAEESSFIYSFARGAISVSLSNDMRRYSSDRLPRIIASGGIALIKRFPDMETFGFKSGRNCFIWNHEEELAAIIKHVLNSEIDLRPIRESACKLAREKLTWDVAIEELCWMIEKLKQLRSQKAKKVKGKGEKK